MLDRKYVNFQVNCLREPYRVEKMQMTFVRQEGGWFPLPCNGCDSLNGHKACEECCANMTEMFFRNPELDISKPITPKRLEHNQ